MVRLSLPRVTMPEKRMLRRGEAAMRLRIGRDALAEAGAWAARALPSRPVIPVLAGLLLEAGEGDGLILSCFDCHGAAAAGADDAVAQPGLLYVACRQLAE